MFVCVWSPLRPSWCGAVSVHLVYEKDYFSSSHCLKGPPNFITSRQLTGHLGAQGVEWCLCVCMLVYMHICGCWACKNTTRFNESSKKTKTSAIPWLKHKGKLSPVLIWPFFLLSKHSVETPQHSGNKIQTHASARRVSSGKSKCVPVWES